MNENLFFRIIVTTMILVSLSISIYFRRKAQIHHRIKSIAARKVVLP